MLLAKSEVIGSKDILRFLQLLCEGHHLRLQNYLREQPGSSTSINIVSEIMRFLKEVCVCPAQGPLKGPGPVKVDWRIGARRFGVRGARFP